VKGVDVRVSQRSRIVAFAFTFATDREAEQFYAETLASSQGGTLVLNVAIGGQLHAE